MFALSPWVVLQSGDVPESPLLQDSQPALLPPPSWWGVVLMGFQEGEKQMAALNLFNWKSGFGSAPLPTGSG